MVRSVLLTFSLITVFVTCTYHDSGDLNNTCMVNNPATDLPWLKAIISQYETSAVEMSQYLYITQATHEGHSVFIFGSCCPNCNTVIPVYDCHGDFLFYRFDKEQADKIKDEKMIWRAANSMCASM